MAILKKRIFCVLLPLLLLLCMVSCRGGLNTRSSILAKDLISGESLEINLPVERSNVSSPSQRFSVKMNLDEMADAVRSVDDSLTVSVCRDKLILIQTKTGVFCLMPIEKVEGDGEDDVRYTFFAPAAQFKIDTERDTYVEMYVPYHLIDGVQIQTEIGYPEAYPKTLTCDVCGSIEEFIQFYSALEQCEVEKTGDDSLVVTYRNNAYKMELSFFNDDGQSKVTFSVS